MIVKLPFGRETVAADLRGLRVRALEPNAPRAAAPAAELVAAAVDRPLAGEALAELARGRKGVVIVVPDGTRRAHLPEVLPVLLERLGRAGIAAASTVVLVACGTHPAASGDELSELVGELPDGVTVVQHSCRDDAALVEVGRLSDGTPVRLNRLAVEAPLLITLGPVQHHYFAGFGGGPKMVFPGVAGHDEIQANHSRVLDLTGERPRRHPACEPGVLAGNPVAEEIATAAALRRPDLALCLVEGRDRRPAWAGAGPLDAVFPAAVERARAWYETTPASYRLVVACGGGAPADHTLIQAHKALDAACRFAADDGEVVFVAELSGGAGSPAMAPFLAEPAPEAILDRLRERWVQYGHTTLRLVEKTGRLRVHLVSRLEGELAGRLGFVPVVDPDAVLDRWREEYPGETVGVVAGAPVYPASS